MKTRSSRRASGFTLVEILVVIAIIAVLASFGTAAGLRAIQKARATATLKTAHSLQTAINQFYSEYSSMPMPSLTVDTTISTALNDAQGQAFLNALLGTETIATPLNPRGIKFLSVEQGKNNKDGLIYGTGNLVTGLHDSWGGPYRVILDGDYNEIISANTIAATTPPVVLNGRHAAVFSNGPDYAAGASGKIVDDVKTW